MLFYPKKNSTRISSNWALMNQRLNWNEVRKMLESSAAWIFSLNNLLEKTDCKGRFWLLMIRNTILKLSRSFFRIVWRSMLPRHVTRPMMAERQCKWSRRMLSKTITSSANITSFWWIVTCPSWMALKPQRLSGLSCTRWTSISLL